MVKVIKHLYNYDVLTGDEIAVFRRFDNNVCEKIFRKARKILGRWKKTIRVNCVQYLFLTKDGWVSISYSPEYEVPIDKEVIERYYVKKA